MTPFSIKIPDEQVRDLKSRLRQTRWPETVDAPGWRQGTDPEFLQRFLQKWELFEWRNIEREINSHEQFFVNMERADLHILRIKSGIRDAIPIMLCHGWPSSFLEMMALGRCLSSAENGNRPAFDVIIPSLPGFGFSRQKAGGAWGIYDYCDVLFEAMTELGYRRFAVHAYDIAASVMSLGAFRFPDRIIGYHTTEPGIPAPFIGEGARPLRETEQAYLNLQNNWNGELGAYMHLLRTKPQTVAYGLSDSPSATAAWLLEKWHDWTAPPGPLEDSIPLDALLAQASLFWFTNSLNTANRFYFRDDQSRHWARTPETKIHVPTAVILNATQPVEHAPREYASRIFADIRHWRQAPSGGHFIACEKPEVIADSIFEFFGKLF